MQELKDLFPISKEICKQRALELLPTNPNHLGLLQILAACESLDEFSRDFNKAIELYQKCLDINPHNIEYYNNLAKNYIEISDFYMAATYLNDIKQKWNHPAIYSNLALVYEKGNVTDIKLIDEAVEKMEEYRRHYPDFDSEQNKSFIHTFLLQPDQNYNTKEVKQFQSEIKEAVSVFQNMIHTKLDVCELKKTLQTIQPKIDKQLDREEKYGIRIDNYSKAVIQVFEVFRKKLIPVYKFEWGHEIDRMILKAIHVANDVIFNQKIDLMPSYYKIYEQEVEPCLISLDVIANEIERKINELENGKMEMKEKKPDVHVPAYGLFSSQNKLNLEKNIANEKKQRPNDLFQAIKESEKIVIEKEAKERRNESKPQGKQQVNLNEKKQKRLIEKEKEQQKIHADEKENWWEKYEVPSERQVRIPLEQKNFNKMDEQFEDRELEQARMKDANIRKNETKDREINFDREQIPINEYEFKPRLTEIEDFIAKYEPLVHEVLRVESQQTANPFFVIVHIQEHNISSFYAYFNELRIKNELTKSPLLPNLEQLAKESRPFFLSKWQKTFIVEYIHIINLLFKVYHLYSSNNFDYKAKTNQQGKGNSLTTQNLNINQYMSLIAPVLNQFFSGDEELFQNVKFGWILHEIHYGVCLYFQTLSSTPIKFLKNMLRRISAILNANQNAVQQLMNELLRKGNEIFLDHLVKLEIYNIHNGSLQQNYFNWKMNRFHLLNENKQVVRSGFNLKCDEMIPKVCLLMITLGEKVLLEEDILVEAFTGCFYKSGHQYKDEIVKKFYFATNEKPFDGKGHVSSILKRAVKLVVPF